MAYKFLLPDVGEGMAEGEIATWLVKEGDKIEVDQPMLELQNDKLLQEIPSPVAGTVLKLLVEEGTIANVGDALIEIDTGEDSDAGSDDTTVDTSSTPESPAGKEAVADPVEGGNGGGGSSTFVFNLPDVGEGMAEGEIASWLVAEGDNVEQDQPILELQNDKLLQEIPSPVSGVVSKIFVEAGTIANVGDPLIEFLTEGGSGTADSVSTPASPTGAVAVEEAAPAGEVSTIPGNTVAGRVLAMPSVRRHARDNSVDLTQVPATGKHGHVTKADVDAFIKNGPAETTAPQVATAPAKEATAPAQATASTPAKEAKPTAIQDGEDVTREKMTPTRRAIAQAMVTSMTKAPQVTIFDEVDATATVEHRNKFKGIAAEQDIKLTFLPYVVKALVRAVKKYPILNSSMDEATNEIVYKNYYNIGIAVDTDRGLYVPNVKNADRKNMFEISNEINELAEKAADGSLSGSEMRDGTITISNIGSASGSYFTPILNYPEVGILGIGRIKKQPIVKPDGTIGVGQMFPLSLTFDHRLVDGMTGQLVLNEVKRLLADPDTLLMES